ncbi:MAG: DUF4198 domain-containing protein [Deltaproteobacteria bacterium]|jgi:nickel transport protein|nr:DUF4198 domain-containing protein [Deltaproteobacteria bacterium]
MTKSFLTVAICLTLAAPLADWASFGRPALAHGVVWRQEASDKTVSLRFLYSDQTTMKYSKVELMSPGDDQVPYQSGVTDKNGGFAFIPDAPGLWKFSANDGQGHLASGELEVVFPTPAVSPGSVATDPAALNDPAAPESASAPAPTPAPPLASGGSKSPTWEKIGLGLSIIVNLALIALLFRRNKPKVNPAS